MAVVPSDASPSSAALRAFGASGAMETLRGGSRPAYRVGALVLKQIHQTSLEHNDSRRVWDWLAPYLHGLDDNGFRLAKPVPLKDGSWQTSDGWTASTFVAGSPATAFDVPACIDAIRAFHVAARSVPHHPLLDQNESVFGTADRICWDGDTSDVVPEAQHTFAALRDLRHEIPTLDHQLIHGDLNLGNLLVEEGESPALIDVAPYWRPADFALALFANWAGPREGEADVLTLFGGVANFDQLLVRAALRMLLIMRDGTGWETSSERRAAEIVCTYANTARF